MFRLIVVSLLLLFIGLTTVVAQEVDVATSIASPKGLPRMWLVICFSRIKRTTAS